jgi:nicotinamide-nucleotide amidase
VLVEDRDAQISALAQRIGQLALADGLTVVVAESLTAGRIAQALGAAPDASTWFAGGVIAYINETKYRLLGVSRGPVITGECAEQMARGALDAVGADASVAVTGVGGPGPEEGQPAGTVFISVSTKCAVRSTRHMLDGTPDEVVALTTVIALTQLKQMLLEA